MSIPSLVSKRLCIIGEADPFLAHLLRRFAEKSGLRVQSARTGDGVMALVQEDRPSLVILEPELPGKLRGWEAARQLRMDAMTRDIPLMICTWLDKDQALVLVGHATTYLQKPDLHYSDFAAAIAAAGIDTAPGVGSS